MSDRVVVAVEDHVAHVRLNRPDKRNGLDLEMFHALIAAGEALAADPRVRAIVLSGEGKAFCSGLDWGAFLAMGVEGATALLARDPAVSPANVAQRAAWVWRESPVPVIAALHGAVYGGGLQIALAADVRICAPDAQLSAMEVRYGIIPDMTLTRTLPSLVRPDLARDLVFTGRIVFGEEAVRIGLATRLADDPLSEALGLAKEIAGRSPHAVRAAKRLLDTAPGLGLAEGLALETELQLPLLGSPNQMAAVQAMMTRRPPVFDDVPARGGGRS